MRDHNLVHFAPDSYAVLLVNWPQNIISVNTLVPLVDNCKRDSIRRHLNVRSEYRNRTRKSWIMGSRIYLKPSGAALDSLPTNTRNPFAKYWSRDHDGHRIDWQFSAADSDAVYRPEGTVRGLRNDGAQSAEPFRTIKRIPRTAAVGTENDSLLIGSDRISNCCTPPAKCF